MDTRWIYGKRLSQRPTATELLELPHFGKAPSLSLVRGDSKATLTPSDAELRGVFQDSDSFPGVVLFKVVDSAGRLRLKVEMPEADVEIGFAARLEKWLDRHDPVPRLKAI